MRIDTKRRYLCVLGVLTTLGAGNASAQDRVPTDRRPPIYTPDYRFGADAGVTADTAITPITKLRDAITLAYWSNPRLLAQRASLRSTDNRYPAARSAYGPTVDVQASYDYSRLRSEFRPGTFSGASGFSSTATAIFNLPLYTFGRNRSAVNSVLAEIALGRDSLRLAEAELMLSVITAYVSVQRDEAALQAARDNLTLLDRQYRDNTLRYQVRDITLTDLQQIETRLELGRAQLLSAQGQLGSSLSLFVQNVGAPPGPLAAPPALPMTMGTLDQALSYAETHNAVIRGAQAREKGSRAQVDGARAQTGPRIDLRGTGNYGPVSPYSDTLRATTLVGQVVLQMPIVDSGLRRAQIREAQEANDADWRLIDSAVRDTRQSVTSSWEQMNAQQSSLEHYRQAVDAAQRAYDGAVLQERAGARTTLDVLDLARDLLNVRTNSIIAQANAYLARANLLAAMGQLEAPLLVPTIQSYDPTVHLDAVDGRGGLPLLRDILSPIDGLTTRDIAPDRPLRDPGTTATIPVTVSPTPIPAATAPIAAPVPSDTSAAPAPVSAVQRR